LREAAETIADSHGALQVIIKVQSEKKCFIINTSLSAPLSSNFEFYQCREELYNHLPISHGIALTLCAKTTRTKRQKFI